MSLDPAIRPDNLTRQWDKLSLAQQQKDMAIQAEIQRYVMYRLQIKSNVLIV